MKAQVTKSVETDETFQELSKHGTKELPIESYQDNCEIFQSIYSHWHKEMEIMYVEKGSGLAQLNKDTLKLQKGDILLINSGTLHHIKSDRRNILYFKSVVFDLSFLFGTPGDMCQEKILNQVMENQARFVHLIHPEDPGYDRIQDLFLRMFACHRKWLTWKSCKTNIKWRNIGFIYLCNITRNIELICKVRTIGLLSKFIPLTYKNSFYILAEGSVET